MSERVFRFILGATLLLLLFFKQEQVIYIYIGILLFEGITNFRVPMLVSRIRYGSDYRPGPVSYDKNARIPFDAERVLRLLVAVFLIVSYVIFREEIWFFPWFIGFMLFMAGMTNICPMVMGLRWAGFR